MIFPFLVEEFLLWLWYVSDNGSHVDLSEPELEWDYPPNQPAALDLWIDGKISLSKESDKASFSGDKMGNDAKEALRVGKTVSGIRLMIREGDLEYAYVLDRDLFRIKVTLPSIDFEDSTTPAVVFGTVATEQRAEQLLDHLFFEFVRRRTSSRAELTAALSAFVSEVDVERGDDD